MILYYNHSERNVTIEDTFEIISIDEAKKLFDDGEVSDSNQAFTTLRLCNWDYNKVVEYYGE